MSTALSLSINVLWTMLLAIFTVMTRASVWGWCTHLVSASVNMMSLGSRQVLLVRHMSALCPSSWGRFLASFAYLSSASQLPPVLCGPLIMVRTPSVAGRSSTRSLVLARPCLLEHAISTFELTPFCLTLKALKLASLHYVLVALKLAFIYCALLVIGLAFVRCILTALGLTPGLLYVSNPRINTRPQCLNRIIWVRMCGFNSQINISQLNTCSPRDTTVLYVFVESCWQERTIIVLELIPIH